MTEERKHAILFVATILSARKLIDCIESDKPNFTKEYWVDKAINEVAFISGGRVSCAAYCMIECAPDGADLRVVAYIKE